MKEKPTGKGLAAIYRQEIIQDVTLFTSQSAAKFYEKLFNCLDFTLPRAATGRCGFPKEAMVCAFLVMKCEGFSQITDLKEARDLVFVRGKGHHKSGLQKAIETINSWLERLKRYNLDIHICGDRNSNIDGCSYSR